MAIVNGVYTSNPGNANAGNSAFDDRIKAMMAAANAGPVSNATPAPTAAPVPPPVPASTPVPGPAMPGGPAPSGSGAPSGDTSTAAMAGLSAANPENALSNILLAGPTSLRQGIGKRQQTDPMSGLANAGGNIY